MPFATVDGRRLHYREAGSAGPALVLLHAFPLHSGMWEQQLEGLSSLCRVIAPDLPGFGRSEPLPEPAATSLDSAADAVAGLLAELDVSGVVLGGLSMGGYIAFSFARRHRPHLRALVLADTRAGADTTEVRERRSRQQAQVREEGTAEVVEALLGTLLSDGTRQSRPEVADRTRTLMQAATPDAVVAALEAMKGRADATDDLAALDVPTLVLVGEHDAMAPPEVAQEMQGRLPDARLAVIPDAGHLSSLENPDAFNAEVRSFLENLETGG